MKKKITETILKNDFWYAIAKVIRNRNSKDFLSTFRNYNSVVRIHAKEGSLNKAPICIFNNNSDKVGLFAYLRRVADFLYYCDCMGFSAYIMWDDSLYFDKQVCETENPFEYYFEQPCGLNAKELESRAIVDYSPGSILLSRECISGPLYNPGTMYLEKLASVIRRYLHFNEKTIMALEQFIENKKLDEHVLGIHIRGTDYKKTYKNHPVYIGPSSYYPVIDKAMESNQFCRLFLATDDNEILNEFTSHYGNDLVVYETKTMRGSGNMGIHNLAVLDNSSSPYQEGLYALCDMVGLSHCGGIISGMSNVAMLARVFNKSYQEQYRFDWLIDHGINKSGIIAAKEKIV